MSDYVDASKDIMIGLKRRPLRSIFLLVSGGIAISCHKMCPSLNSYKNEVIYYSNELGLCAENARNNESKMYIDQISTLLSDGCIQFVNLGIFSLMVERPRSLQCQNYHTTCKHLKPRIWTYYSRIIDIGVLDMWLLLSKKMADFDINESEFY